MRSFSCSARCALSAKTNGAGSAIMRLLLSDSSSASWTPPPVRFGHVRAWPVQPGRQLSVCRSVAHAAWSPQPLEPLRTGTGNIKLDAGEAGQIPAHAPGAKRLAGHSPVGQGRRTPRELRQPPRGPRRPGSRCRQRQPDGRPAGSGSLSSAAQAGLRSATASAAERRVDLVLTQPRPVISEPPLDKLDVEGVLGVLQELLPCRDGDQDRLRAAVRAKEHRFGVTLVESPGDLAKRSPDLAGRHNGSRP